MAAVEPKQSFHMTPSEFRRRGKEMSTGLPTITSGSKSFRCSRRRKPGQLRAALPPQAPECGESFDAMMAGCRTAGAARHHALAIAELFRVLPFQ